MQMQDIFDNKNITANSEQLAVLKQNFPNCFDKNGKFDIQMLSQMIGSENIKKEGFELKFLGKSYARLMANLNPKTLLTPDQDHNAKNKNAQNLLIKGDNLEVLKHLKNAYFESIKMIYIDPPYNTGSDGFAYSDDRKFSVDELSSLAGISQEEAKRVLEFTAKGLNSHSAWLSFIYPRLYIARELLRDDGVIFISIDDNEQAQLKILCDEIFGEENFIGDFIRKTKSTTNDAKTGLNYQHEFLICYAKNINFVNLLGGEKDLSNYKNLDNDPNGAWISDNPSAKSGTIENGYFAVTNPYTGKVDYPPEGRFWLFSQNTIQKHIDDGRICFKKEHKENERGFIYKRYLKDLKTTQKTFDSLKFTNNEFMNQSATKELLDLGLGEYFTYPKGVNFIQEIIKHATSKTTQDEIIMDFFAGSGTTAHAVMAQNLEDGGNRKFILVQLDEKIDEKKSKMAYDFCKNELKSKDPTIFDITKERILRAAQSLSLSDDEAWLKFKIFSTTPLLKSYLDSIENNAKEEETKLFYENKFSKDDLTALLTTFAVYDGVKLTDELRSVNLDGYEAYYAQKKLYLLNANFSSENLRALIEKIDGDKEFMPEKIVLFEPNFKSSKWRELDEAIKNYANKKNLQINLIARH